MKRFLLLSTILLIGNWCFSQNADFGIVLQTYPSSVYLGDTSILKVTISNAGTQDIAAGTLFPQFTCSSNSQMVGIVTASSSTKFTVQFTVAADSANTYRLINTGGSIPAGTSEDVYIYLKSVHLGYKAFTGFVVYSPYTFTNGTVGGFDPSGHTLATNTAQGNLTTINDNDTTSLLVLAPPVPLPIHFVSVDAIWKQNDAKVSWQVADEAGSDYYAIERSLDGENFKEIGKVAYDAKSSDNGLYNYYDSGFKNTLNGKVFYRIKQMSLNKTSLTSNIVTLSNSNVSKAKCYLYPNPVTNSQFTFVYESPESQDGNVEINITDALGRTVLQNNMNIQSGVNSTPIQVFNLTSGMYQLHYYNKTTNDIGSIKFVKD